MTIDVHGKAVVIDDEDWDRIKDFKLSFIGVKRNYVRCRNRKKYVTLHRFLVGLTDKGLVVDHINGDTLDNRKSNLRVCTAKQNCSNRGKYHTASSPYKGVTWHKRIKKWQSQLRSSGKTKHLGYFKCQTAAWFAYVREASVVFGEYARFK